MAISLKAFLKDKKIVTDSAHTATVGKVYQSPRKEAASSRHECREQSPKEKPVKNQFLEDLLTLEKQKMSLRTQKAKLSNALVDNVIAEEEDVKRGKIDRLGNLAIEVMREKYAKERASIYAKIETIEKEERSLGSKIAYAKKYQVILNEENKNMRTAKKRAPIDEENLYSIEKEIQTLSSERSACNKRIPDRPRDDPKRLEWEKKVSDYTVRINELRDIKKRLLNVQNA